MENEKRTLSEGDMVYYNEMKEHVKALWKIVAYCIIGWSLFFFGFVTSKIFFLVIGSVIVGFPTLLAYWKGGFSGMWIGSESSNSSKRTVSSNDTGNFALSIILKGLVSFFVALIGIVFTVIRVVIIIIKYFACQNAHKNVVFSFKESILLPLSIGVGSFIGLPILIGLITKMLGMQM